MISELAKTHSMSAQEVARLEWVLTVYEPHEHEQQLQKETKDILAARILATNPQRKFGSETLRRLSKHV